MPELVSLRALAKRLRVPQRWLREQAAEGRIPCLRAGKQILFERHAVEAALAARAAREPTS